MHVDTTPEILKKSRNPLLPGLQAMAFFLAISLAVSAFVLLPAHAVGVRDWSEPLWLRFARFVAHVARAMNQPGSCAVELLVLPAAAAWGAWAACCRVLPQRRMECLAAGALYGFAPYMLSLLAHGVARQAFGHAALPFLLLALLAHGASGRKLYGWLAVAWLVLMCFLTRDTLLAAVFVWGLAWLYASSRSLAAGRLALSWVWLLPCAGALFVFLVAPFGGCLSGTYPSAAALRGASDLLQRLAGVFVLRSSLGPGLIEATAPTAYLGKVVLLLTVLALAAPVAEWRVWKLGWLAAFGCAMVFYIMPEWWLRMVIPSASVVVLLGPWQMFSPVMLFSALLSAMILAHILDVLRFVGWFRVLLVLIVCWWLLVDAVQAVPRGWSELRGPAGRNELESEPATLPAPLEGGR